MCKRGQFKICRVMVCADDSHSGLSYWADKAIDACIADKIEELNAKGMFTISCCCGHGGKGSIVLQDGTVIEIDKNGHVV